MSVSVWLFLLLPVAAVSGWIAARRSQRRTSFGFGEQQELSQHGYYKGLNYLLHDRPDKALEVFVNMVEVDSETVETHLALGALFRRRGEVDRAIRIHQNVIVRPQLSAEQRDQAKFELGIDYFRAGFLDRAEEAFTELLKSLGYEGQARDELLLIFQQQKEWEKALSLLDKMLADKIEVEENRKLAAQFCCEMAAEAFANKALDGVSKWAKRALSYSPQAYRAYQIMGDLAKYNGDYANALLHYQKAVDMRPDFWTELSESIQFCFRQCSENSDYKAWLEAQARHSDQVDPVLALAQFMADSAEQECAKTLLRKELQTRYSLQGMQKLLELLACKPGTMHCLEGEDSTMANAPTDCQLVRDTLAGLIATRAVYRCQQCGFEAKNLHWRCPGCQQWDTWKRVI